MNTIINNTNNELIIKNSKFITYLYKVYNIDDIDNYLKDIKIKYKDATHICYAYIIDNIKKYNDDKEPSNTAGKPMLEILEKNNLNHILAITIRYYGGIKLGTNGLIRAYSKSITNTIKEDNIKEEELGYNVTITFDYNMQKKVDYILKDIIILNKEFKQNIIYNININNDILTKLIELNINIIINDEIYL